MSFNTLTLDEFCNEIKKFDKTVAIVALQMALIGRYSIIANQSNMSDFLQLHSVVKEIFNTDEEYYKFINNLFLNTKLENFETIKNFLISVTNRRNC